MDINKVIYKPLYLEEVKRESNKELFKVVSTFAGGGGSSLGYRLAGGNILAINEFVESARDTYRANWPLTKIYPSDIRELKGSTILKDLNLDIGDLDILDGSPPCASFSLSGNREKDWGKEKKYSDKVQTTDDLFFEYARLIEEIQPKVFIAENVKGLLIGSAKNFFGSSQLGLFGGHNETIYHTLTNLGYTVYYKVLNSKNYGVPQSRERLIIVGVRNDINIPFKYPKPKDYIFSLREAFESIEHTIEDLKEVNIDRFAIYKEAIKLKEGDQSEKYFNLIKVNSRKPSGTLTQTAGSIGAASIIHWDNRKFTVKEAKRIMSFPEDYILKGSYKERIERLGRAVPPLLMCSVAKQVYNLILSKWENR